MIRPLFIAATLLFAASPVTWAQPATDDAAKAANPPNVVGGPQTPEQKAEADRKMQEMMRKAQEQGMAMMKMSPAERKEAMRKMTEQILRANLTRSGFTEEILQNRIVAFIAEQEKSRQKVRETASKVYLALEPRGIRIDEKGMSLLLVNYLDAVETARDEREAAATALDKEIHFSAQPNLMAWLSLNGIIGDASYFTGDVILTGTMSISGLAEFVNPVPAAR